MADMECSEALPKHLSLANFPDARFPFELSQLVAQYLSPGDLLTCARVCRTWRRHLNTSDNILYTIRLDFTHHQRDTVWEPTCSMDAFQTVRKAERKLWQDDPRERDIALYALRQLHAPNLLRAMRLISAHGSGLPLVELPTRSRQVVDRKTVSPKLCGQYLVFEVPKGLEVVDLQTGRTSDLSIDCTNDWTTALYETFLACASRDRLWICTHSGSSMGLEQIHLPTLSTPPYKAWEAPHILALTAYEHGFVVLRSASLDWGRDPGYRVHFITRVAGGWSVSSKFVREDGFLMNKIYGLHAEDDCVYLLIGGHNGRRISIHTVALVADPNAEEGWQQYITVKRSVEGASMTGRQREIAVSSTGLQHQVLVTLFGRSVLLNTCGCGCSRTVWYDRPVAFWKDRAYYRDGGLYRSEHSTSNLGSTWKCSAGEDELRSTLLVNQSFMVDVRYLPEHLSTAEAIPYHAFCFDAGLIEPEHCTRVVRLASPTKG